MQDKSEPTFEAAIDCIDRVISKLKCETSSKMRSAVVALFTSDYDQRLRYSSQICLMHLDFDRHLKTSFLRFYHLEDFSLLMQVQLYYGFMQSYKVKNKQLNVWGFDLWRMGTICVQFRNQNEAHLFAVKLEQYAPKRQALLQLSKRQVQEQLRKKKENSFFGKIKNIFKGTTANKKQESVVLEVVKSNSICIDKLGNFKSESMSPEWQQILRRCGLKPSDMKDRQIAKLVMEETIIYEAKKAVQINPNFLVSAGIQRVQELQQEENQTQEEENNEQNTIQVQSQKQKIRQLQETSTTLSNFIPQPQILEITLPPPPIFDLPPPPLPSPLLGRVSTRRQNLLQEIRKNNIKLRPVKTNGENMQLDASSLNKQQRIDLASQIRRRLQIRRAVLNRHHSDEDD